MKKWICRQCGYTHYGDEAPDSCPQCGATKSQFRCEKKRGEYKCGILIVIVVVVVSLCFAFCS